MRFTPLFAAALASCALFVHPPEGGTVCAFAGRDTSCGRCLAERCQQKIDACCSDDSCGGIIGLVEGCAEALDDRCDEIHAAATDAGASPTAEQQLAKCMGELCRGACEHAPATSSSRCSETQFGYGAACACQPAGAGVAANRFVCDSTRFPATRCCAPPTWPALGTECTCLVVACGPMSGGCSCYLSDARDPNARTECHGTICCQAAQACRCGDSACGSGETQVDVCDARTTPCAVGSRDFDSCSLP